MPFNDHHSRELIPKVPGRDLLPQAALGPVHFSSHARAIASADRMMNSRRVGFALSRLSQLKKISSKQGQIRKIPPIKAPENEEKLRTAKLPHVGPPLAINSCIGLIEGECKMKNYKQVLVLALVAAFTVTTFTANQAAADESGDQYKYVRWVPGSAPEKHPQFQRVQVSLDGTSWTDVVDIVGKPMEFTQSVIDQCKTELGNKFSIPRPAMDQLVTVEQAKIDARSGSVEKLTNDLYVCRGLGFTPTVTRADQSRRT